VGMLQAPPSTRLFTRMSEAGRVLGSMSGDNVDGTTNIRPVLGLETLQHHYRALVTQLYEPAHYYARVRTFLREFRVPAVRARLDTQRLLAFVRSIGRLGIAGRGRLAYWKLLVWTVVRRPRLLPNAVTLAIYGYHFRRITQRLAQ